ncbi:hypothetical protein SCG7109_AC_00190 [Chlamydiales bacterium SCGC AG-110-M15]|nr:hypothetical protein SCG7109_AC_00190 [Chlamydiales bacterium SCGC AG-110-M15]
MSLSSFALKQLQSYNIEFKARYSHGLSMFSVLSVVKKLRKPCQFICGDYNKISSRVLRFLRDLRVQNYSLIPARPYLLASLL